MGTSEEGVPGSHALEQGIGQRNVSRIKRRGSLLENDFSKGESRLEQREGLEIKGPHPNKGWGRVISVGEDFWAICTVQSWVLLLSHVVPHTTACTPCLISILNLYPAFTFYCYNELQVTYRHFSVPPLLCQGLDLVGPNVV